MLDVGRSIGWKTSWGENRGFSQMMSIKPRAVFWTYQMVSVKCSRRWYPGPRKGSPRGSTQVNERSALGHILDTIGGEEPD